MSMTRQEDLISFFRLGGIHGMPYKAWDGVGGEDPAQEAGYCTHGSVLFPTWHRPYIALYEVSRRTGPALMLSLTRETYSKFCKIMLKILPRPTRSTTSAGRGQPRISASRSGTGRETLCRLQRLSHLRRSLLPRPTGSALKSTIHSTITHSNLSILPSRNRSATGGQR